MDYYLTLNGTIDLDTGEIRNYFHISLEHDDDKMMLGNFTIDPKSTDFIGKSAKKMANALSISCTVKYVSINQCIYQRKEPILFYAKQFHLICQFLFAKMR